MSSDYVLCLAAGTEVGAAASGSWHLSKGAKKTELGALTEVASRALVRLSERGATEVELAQDTLSSEGNESDLQELLNRLSDQGLLCRGVRDDRGLLAIVEPGPAGDAVSRDLLPDERVLLSRFALLRRIGDCFYLESPLSRSRVAILSQMGFSVVSALAEPSRPAQLAESLGESAGALIGVLWNLEMLTLADETGTSLDDQPDALVPWEFHDLLFHTRSRLGRHFEPYGRTEPYPDLAAATPVFKPPVSTDHPSTNRPSNRLALARSGSVGRVADGDSPEEGFEVVVERRVSRRRSSDAPLTVEQLGEFLDRSAGTRPQREGEQRGWIRRVYPGGGAAYELEIYVVAHECEGIERGLYHYEPESHALEVVSAATTECERLLDLAAKMAATEKPQALLLISSRIQRLSTHYRSISYATTLKNVGVLFESMYLTASAMGLAGCALGGGDADLFAEATGTEYYSECSVGEFMLNSGPSS